MAKDYDDDYPRQTDEEIARDIINRKKIDRERRDLLLSESDWVVTKAMEEGTEIPTNWKTYRQALRDLPAHSSFPNLQDNDYPTKPS
tara:strand:- start:813 stop:1073 length:261 start_codon:yes stop_codon:yes gene_type:complete